MEVFEFYRKMGIEVIFICILYYGVNFFKFGDYIVWSESLVVSFVNFIFGVRINREGGFLSFVVVIVGKILNYGFYFDENRKVMVIVDVKVKVKIFVDYLVFGYYVGKIFGNDVFYFKNLKFEKIEFFKEFGVVMGVIGLIVFYYVEGEIFEYREVIIDKLEMIIVEDFDFKVVREFF